MFLPPMPEKPTAGQLCAIDKIENGYLVRYKKSGFREVQTSPSVEDIANFQVSALKEIHGSKGEPWNDDAPAAKLAPKTVSMPFVESVTVYCRSLYDVASVLTASGFEGSCVPVPVGVASALGY